MNINSLEKTKPSVEKFSFKHLSLLELERDAEVNENKCLRESCSVRELQRRGLGISSLSISAVSTGLYGKTLLTFQSYCQKTLFKANNISSGDIVGVATYESNRLEVIVSGVVVNASDISLSVAFEEEPDSLDQEQQYVIVKLANDVTYKRLKRVLKLLATKGRDHPLVDILFGGKECSASEKDTVTGFVNGNLDSSQQNAVRFAMRQKDLAIIHGPPGTGKTTTIVECISQAARYKNKVLACAPSNIAVDNLLEKLSSDKTLKVVRLGHPGRALPTLRDQTLDAIITRYEGSDVVREMTSEIDKLRSKIKRSRGHAERRSLRAEQKSLLKELRNRERRILNHALSHADVVLATLTSASDDGPLQCIDNLHFDLCVIDECSQATEAACWIPLLRCRGCILAGDHLQLPPTIVSKEAATQGLEVSLLERAVSVCPSSVRMLNIQYRMHETIMQWPSQKLYGGKLEAHSSVRFHLLHQIEGVEENSDTCIPLLLIDTAPLGLQEIASHEDGDSRGNEGEADIASAHARVLMASGLLPEQIAVITPYSLQAELIRNKLHASYPQIEIKSVDGFQGREKEAVILSLVRSNDDKDVGFLAEDRRINVAITRSRRHLAVICDTRTVSFHSFLKDFIEYCEKNGEYRTAFEYQSDINRSANTSDIPKEKKKLTTTKSRSSTNTTKTFKAPHRHTEEEIKSVEDSYQQLLVGFMKEDKNSLRFPPSLSAFHRRSLHEVAERLGLLHISSGDGTDRYIEIRKPSNAAASDEAAGDITNELTDSSTSSAEAENEHLETTGPTHPKSDLDLMEVLANVLENTSSSKQLVSNQGVAAALKDISLSTKVSKSKGQLDDTVSPPNFPVDDKSTLLLSKNKARVRRKPESSKLNQPKLKVLPIDGEEDFDALIEKVTAADNICRFGKCKTSVAVLVQECSFCKGRFCFSHSMPELHGCGDAVRAYARRMHKREKNIKSRTDPVRKANLQKALDKKISEMATNRQKNHS